MPEDNEGRTSHKFIYLQETHLSRQESEKLKRFACTNSFYSSFRRGCKRGVITLVPKSVKFECVKEMSDVEGRFIPVKGKLENKNGDTSWWICTP